MNYEYRPRGVCSMRINFDLTDGRVHHVTFLGGCDGNLKAIGKLVEGMDAQALVDLLRGNTCGGKPTSCADQLALAVAGALEKEAAGVS